MVKRLLCVFLAGGLAWALGASTPARAAPVKLGFINSMTGPEAPIGESLTNGLELAKEDIAKKGIKLQIISQDDTGKPQVSMSALEQLATVPAVQKHRVHVVERGAVDQVTALALQSSVIGQRTSADIVLRQIHLPEHSLNQLTYCCIKRNVADVVKLLSRNVAHLQPDTQLSLCSHSP